ncbi:MAG: MBL fold metallo-hydrolase [Turneriella sp.]|nr:MBL fold metallo-hydrolase [Turneriella sp.]
MAISILLLNCYPLDTKSKHTIYALKYGESYYPAKLIHTTLQASRVKINWLAYLVKDSRAGLTLIDCGFSDANWVRRFQLWNFKAVDQILADMGVQPNDVDTIILTHTHFDHAMDVDKYPRAKVYLHKVEAENPQEPLVAKRLQAVRRSHRLVTIKSPTTLASGLELIPVSGHTPGSLVVKLQMESKLAVFTGDECYSAAACRAKIPLPVVSAYSRANNQAFIESLAGVEAIFAGHEPDLENGQWLNPWIFRFEGLF